MLRLDRAEEGVWVLQLQASRTDKGSYENKFTPSLIMEIDRALDQVLKIASNKPNEPCALVLTSKGKFFSNGHDIDWLENAAAQPGGTEPDGEAAKFIGDFYKLLVRFMTLPIFTVAAINGHAFAGGCLLAIAQDYRVMRSDRGFICMNEIDMVLLAGDPTKDSAVKPGIFKNADQKMISVLAAKLPVELVRTMMLEGRRYDGEQAKASGIVHDTVKGEKEMLQQAIELAAKVGKKSPYVNRRTVSVLKYELVRPYINALTEGRFQLGLESSNL